jgi:hypothetical protein
MRVEVGSGWGEQTPQGMGKVRTLYIDTNSFQSNRPFRAWLSRCGKWIPLLLSFYIFGPQSEASEWELRERREREEERRVGAEGLGAEVEEPLFFPTPAFMASAEEE